MIRHTKRCIEEAQSGIAEGKIPIRPYRMQQMTPCAYCEFGEICRFDPKANGYREITMNKSDAEGLIRGEAEK
jgi:ATP-dependent helicase/DNAse subunit B